MSSRRTEFAAEGFLVLPGFLDPTEIEPALAAIPNHFPTAAGFHDGTDERRARFLGDEFAGIDKFPFASVELSMLCVSPRLVALAAELLGDDDLRVTCAEAWAKYTGATEYDQALHRDYLNHTIVVPSDDARYEELEMFVYLSDLADDLGATRFVSRRHTRDLPAVPNFLTREGHPLEGGRFVESGHDRLYDAEASIDGPAGTVAVFTTSTFHRGTAMRREGGARYTLHVCFRPAAAEWEQRRGWADRSHERAWYQFIERATPAQRSLFGFPPPGHPYWTDATRRGVQARYPGIDLAPYSVSPR
jgi:hypothetical protein